ncbi:hypothetical protein ACLGL1_02885, partial [Peptococcus simiae]|uniref:hypothetical protein n=1 Tax=Peptococcus simiae TaxID=1643805 RepID=UPI0039811BD7
LLKFRQVNLSTFFGNLFSNQNLSKSFCVATSLYLKSSLFFSVNISLTRPMVSKDKSEIERPSSTALKRNKGVVIGLSVGLTFFRNFLCQIGLMIYF